MICGIELEYTHRDPAGQPCVGGPAPLAGRALRRNET